MNARAPQPLTDDDNTRLAGLILIDCEEAPCDGLHSKGREIIRRSDFAVHALGKFSGLEVEISITRGA